jgi:RimJ/RimL family protein N-acetyltransferase
VTVATSLLEPTTGRLRMRRGRASDRAPFAAMNADPDVMRYFPALLDRAASDASIDAWMAAFDERGWSNWAVETRAGGEFIGFVGLSIPKRVLPFSPCVEVGWRLDKAFWGRGYATEAAEEALRIGFEAIGLEEIVSFTTLANRRSRAVMERIGMRDAHEDFDYPTIPEGHPLRPHCLYRLGRAAWLSLERPGRP